MAGAPLPTPATLADAAASAPLDLDVATALAGTAYEPVRGRENEKGGGGAKSGPDRGDVSKDKKNWARASSPPLPRSSSTAAAPRLEKGAG